MDEDGKEAHDDFRLMAELLFNSASPTCAREFAREVGNRAKIAHPNLKIQPLTPLKSLPGGTNQFYHGDYDQVAISKLEPGKKFYSCIFSFSAPTHLLVKDKHGVETKMKIPRGHLLIWDHDVMHARGSYSKLNYRLLFKLAYEENQFPFGDGDSDVSLSVLRKHCGKDFPTRKKRNDHSWTCDDNPKGNDNHERKNKNRRVKKDKK